MRNEIVGSSFFFTINANITANEKQNLPLMDKFGQVMRKLVLSQMMLNFIVVKDEEDARMDKKDLINSIDSKFQLEVGQKYHRLHTHGVLKIFHYSTITFNDDKLKKWLVQQMDRGVMLNVRFANSGAEEIRMLRYVEKNRTEKKPMSVTASLTELSGKTRSYQK